MNKNFLPQKPAITNLALLFILAGILLLINTGVNAQYNLKNWDAVQLNLSLTKKLDLRLGHLQSFNTSNGFISDFNQSTAHLEYDITKRFSVSAGAIIGSLSSADGANRYTLRGTYRLPLANTINWYNALQGEVHSLKETHYRYRVLYSTRLALKKRIRFLNLLPSASYTLFYNIGGKSIQYYDKNNLPVTRQTPDGFHRSRLSFNLNSKISRNVSFTVYYMIQREFNLFTGTYHEMNVVNPLTGKIIRPFHNYNVIGATLAFDINLYKKKQKKQHNKPEEIIN